MQGPYWGWYNCTQWWPPDIEFTRAHIFALYFLQFIPCNLKQRLGHIFEGPLCFLPNLFLDADWKFRKLFCWTAKCRLFCMKINEILRQNNPVSVACRHHFVFCALLSMSSVNWARVALQTFTLSQRLSPLLAKLSCRRHDEEKWSWLLAKFTSLFEFVQRAGTGPDF